MPQLIKHIDAIARAKGRGVLFAAFGNLADLESDWENHTAERDALIAFLGANDIAWAPCAHIADENMMMGYRGLIYIDVPYDAGDPRYKIVAEYLEHPDGTMKRDSIGFFYLPLEDAMKNAHHDEPGFWERWADSF